MCYICSVCVSFFSYRACYTYEIDNGACSIMDPMVEDIDPTIVGNGDSYLYLIETPQLSPSNFYPAKVLCYFVIGKK